MSTILDGSAFRLDGKKAVVTGAGRGIGRACAEALAAAGADVALMSRTQAELDAVASTITAAGGSAAALCCDVTDVELVTEAFDATAPVDVLVNSAGTNIPEPFVDVTEAHLDQLLAINVKGTFLPSQALARQLVAAGRCGAIVNVSSQMGRVGSAGRTAYCATKHAVEGLTKALAIELAGVGIRVNSVAPTFVETAMVAAQLDDDHFRSWVLDRIPLGRIAELDDVAAAALYLASPAAAMVTGASLAVDGGWTAQ